MSDRGLAGAEGDRFSSGKSSGLVPSLARDLSELFPRSDSRPFLLAVGLLLVVIYWYLGAPSAGEARSLVNALRWVLWALLLLGLIPMWLTRPLGLDPRELGLRLGDVRSGIQSLLLGIPLAAVLGFIASRDAAILLDYPWAGSWPGESPGNFLVWALTYAVYYLAYEFFFRGFLLRGLEPWLGRAGSLWLQTAISTLLHLGKPLIETLAALPAGLLFGLVALRTRSLLYVVLIHLALGLSTDFFALLAKAIAP